MMWPQVLEGVMLVCFGASWPFSILKMLRTRQAAGKSAAFISLVLTGYLAGLTAKLVAAASTGRPVEPLAALYAFNAALVALDLVLYVRYRPRPAPADAEPHCVTGDDSVA